MSQYIIKNIVGNTIECSIKNTTNANTEKKIQPDWGNINALAINHYPWYRSGKKQNTHIKLCTNSDTLFLQIIAQDNYSFAKQTKLNHMLICEDSCVEFFFSPSGVLGSSYVNVEVSCCGTLHLAYGPGRDNRQFISLDSANLIHCNSSISRNCKEPVKIESDQDKEWVVEMSLPFAVIEQLTGEKVNMDKWFANFYRCGGRKDPQYAAWNNIDITEPDYHRPEYFGKLVFE